MFSNICVRKNMEIQIVQKKFENPKFVVGMNFGVIYQTKETNTEIHISIATAISII